MSHSQGWRPLLNQEDEAAPPTLPKPRAAALPGEARHWSVLGMVQSPNCRFGHLPVMTSPTEDKIKQACVEKPKITSFIDSAASIRRIKKSLMAAEPGGTSLGVGEGDAHAVAHHLPAW